LNRREELKEKPEFTTRVIHINRVAKVVKGGRRFSFNALVSVGNEKGKVGIGLGKANELSEAIRKGPEIAHREMLDVPIINGTIPHMIISKDSASKVVLKPASEGTGVIAGGPVRSVLEVAGIRNILTKTLGSRNPHNVVKATIKGLLQLRNARIVAEAKGITVKVLFSMEN
jgi:small subunit ribosomal protein S5